MRCAGPGRIYPNTRNKRLELSTPAGSRSAAEGVRWIVFCLDALQPFVVWAVVGVCPVSEVWVWEVREHAPGSPGSHRSPRLCQPALCCVSCGLRGVRIDCGGVLE